MSDLTLPLTYSTLITSLLEACNEYIKTQIIIIIIMKIGNNNAARNGKHCVVEESAKDKWMEKFKSGGQIPLTA